MISTSRELLCFVCAHKLTVICLLYEIYKMNRYPSTRVVHCTLQMKLRVELGVHSKAVGRHRLSINCPVLEGGLFQVHFSYMKLALHAKYFRGGASMYFKKHKKSSVMASFGAWDFVYSKLTYDQLSYAEF